MNVSSVKNLNGEAFSAVQDATLTDVVQTNSAQWNEISAYEQNSASYITAHQSLEGYATEQWVGEQGYLTAVDLTPYQTTAGMTAYQPAGDYATTNDLEQVSAEITATIPSTAGLASESYVQNNSAVLTGMIDAKQDALTFGYDEQDRINSINNSALAGGGDVPEGTMVESNLEYNSQGYINGYNGSAVATIDQERQWFTHDDTLCHISNSAQYALGINMSAISADLARMMGVDETVLWSGELSVGQTAALTENYSAFRKIEFGYRSWSTAEHSQIKYEQFGTQNAYWQTLDGWLNNNLKAIFIGDYHATDANHITLTSACFNNITATNAWSNASSNYRLFEIRGIGRKS